MTWCKKRRNAHDNQPCESHSNPDGIRTPSRLGFVDHQGNSSVLFGSITTSVIRAAGD